MEKEKAVKLKLGKKKILVLAIIAAAIVVAVVVFALSRHRGSADSGKAYVSQVSSVNAAGANDADAGSVNRYSGKVETQKTQKISLDSSKTIKEIYVKAGDKVAINQCSMGFDAEVCANQASAKKLPLVNGEAAYTISLFYCLLRKLNSDFQVYVDDKLVYDGRVIFSLCANSKWYGGGYKGAPKAVPDDGHLDCVIVKKGFGRIKLATLVNEYKRGEHLSWPETIYMSGKKMRIVSKTPAAVNVDGECETVKESTFEIIEKGANFVIPTTSDYFFKKEHGII